MHHNKPRQTKHNLKLTAQLGSSNVGTKSRICRRSAKMSVKTLRGAHDWYLISVNLNFGTIWLTFLAFNIFQRSALAPIPSMRHVFLFQIMHARAGSYIEFSGSWKLGAKVTSGASLHSLHWKVLIFVDLCPSYSGLVSFLVPTFRNRRGFVWNMPWSCGLCTREKYLRPHCITLHPGKNLQKAWMFELSGGWETLSSSLSFYSIKIWIHLALTSLGWIATWAVQVAVARWTCDVYTGWPWAKITRIQQADPHVHDSREAKLRASPSLGHRGRSLQGITWITSASTKQWK